MFDKPNEQKKWEGIQAAAFHPNLVGPTLPAIPPFTFPTGPVGPTGTTVLTGVGAPTCAIGDLGDIYIDLSTGITYYKLSQPVPPMVRAIPAPTGNTINANLYDN
ncbi:exosporium leader peptide-containing protein [Bacillus paramobilis]|uniref:exosporium leader peptide-containing protein n=1 Tax=Bacillus paramobilis TaxID=2817477 RepID=UPI0022B6C760